MRKSEAGKDGKKMQGDVCLSPCCRKIHELSHRHVSRRTAQKCVLEAISEGEMKRDFICSPWEGDCAFLGCVPDPLVATGEALQPDGSAKAGSCGQLVASGGASSQGCGPDELRWADRGIQCARWEIYPL